MAVLVTGGAGYIGSNPDRLIANAAKAADMLNWEPKFADIESIVRSAWNWKRRYPNGYED